MIRKCGPKLPSPGREALRRLVCASGLTQAQVAERYGVPLRTLAAYLDGEVPTRALDLYLALSADTMRRAG